jgi:molybdopterin molybdotransferase
MLSFEKALQRVLQHPFPLQIETVPLLQSVGRVLAQEVLADRDFPPFDRVTMDGIALQATVAQSGRTVFLVDGLAPAGSPALTLKSSDHCLEVMTGAVLPLGTDAVVPYEQCRLENGVATILTDTVVLRQNIHAKGIDCSAGEVLLTKGTTLTPAHVGTMATVGLSQVAVYKLPTVAICSTGDELVDIDQTPLSHQIRRSNAYMLAAALGQENIQANLFHLPDQPEAMARELAQIIDSHDVLLCSGAVSKGKFDYLPQVIEEMGLQKVFHAVTQKPGKPLLFGTLPGNKTIFGLPGNPVSTFVCYLLFFKPWLRASLQQSPTQLTAQLQEDVTFKPELTYHLPVNLSYQDGKVLASPVSTSGSGDLTSLLKATAFLTLPANKNNFATGEAYPVTLF